jgi:aerotaxis receptor
MRSNLPVTQNGYSFPADQTLISVTDLKGRITYCNSNFAAVSGYSREELMGQPHNMVRHPDMPEEAFRDMWDTIEGGRPWSALVKNRRKNGDYYWVRANATPMRAGDRTVGYLSVRTKPLDEEVRQFEKLYATMQAEAAAGRLVHVLRRGVVQRKGLLGGAMRIFNPGLRGQLVCLFALAAAAPLLTLLANLPVWAGALTALLAAALGGLAAIRIAVTPLKDVINTANLLASGDLTQFVAVNSCGEIAELQLAFAQLTVSVRTVVRDVRHEVANLLGGTQEIASGNQDLSSRTESQASSLEQTAATMDQISGTVRQTSQLAEEGANSARETSEVAKRSHEAVLTVVDTMQEIADSSKRIGDIIQVIEGVAFQTNILALNAAVEAARAGEQGRGFAVVAAEVRSLAQRTTTAAKEIRSLIEESSSRVELGSKRAADARLRMDEAMESVGKVGTFLDQINSASKEQSLGVGQINEAVSQMDSITQQNAAMVEELAAAASSLNSQVVQVHNSIRVFRLTDKDVTLAEVDAVEMRKQFSRTTTANEGESVDFDKALADHQQWRITLRNAINRGLQLDLESARRDDCCELGRWLHGAGSKRWSSTPAFTSLLQAHKDFHAQAGKAAELINGKRMKEATALMDVGQPFHRYGQQLVTAIRALRESASAGSTSPASTASRKPLAAAAPSSPARAAPAPAARPDAGEGDWTSF